jgi:hypothetical protein
MPSARSDTILSTVFCSESESPAYVSRSRFSVERSSVTIA